MFSLTGTRRLNWDPDELIEEEKEVVATPPSPAPKLFNDDWGPSLAGAAVTQGVLVPGSTGVYNTPPRVIRTRNRTGNGHKKTMTRKLFDEERAIIRGAFTQKNGQFKEEDCVQLRASRLNQVVAIFQVTGFVSYLHRAVASGMTQLRDLPAYLNWMEGKYSSLWAQYNNPRFVALRSQNARARSSGQRMATIPIDEVPLVNFSTRPVLTAFPRAGAYARS